MVYLFPIRTVKVGLLLPNLPTAEQFYLYLTLTEAAGLYHQKTLRISGHFRPYPILKEVGGLHLQNFESEFI